MTAAALLATIYSTREVHDAEGRPVKLNSEITPDEGELLRSLIRDNAFTRTLEVGCAYGLSSLYICDALAGRAAQPHVIIDPFQQTEWQGIGLANLKRAGFSDFELIEEVSELALPQLLTQKRTFEFALIDGYHTFDQTLIDFYFIDRMLEQGGVVVIDDTQLPGVRKAARFIAKLPNYKVVGGARVSRVPPSWKRRLVESALRGLSRVLPRSFTDDAFADPLFHSDLSLGLGNEMVAFRKTAPDQRGSHWFAPF